MTNSVEKTPINELPEYSIIYVEDSGYFIRERGHWQDLNTYWRSVTDDVVEEEFEHDYKLISLPVTHLVDEESGEVFTVEEYNASFEPGRWKRLLDKDGNLKAQSSSFDFLFDWEEGDKVQQLYIYNQNEWRDIPKPFTDEEIEQAKIDNAEMIAERNEEDE